MALHQGRTQAPGGGIESNAGPGDAPITRTSKRSDARRRRASDRSNFPGGPPSLPVISETLGAQPDQMTAPGQPATAAPDLRRVRTAGPAACGRARPDSSSP